MISAVIDTNVIVSGLLRPRGTCGDILYMINSGWLTPIYDDRISDEYRKVLLRSRFGLDPGTVETFLYALKALGQQIVPITSRVVLPDEDDRPFLECACSGGSKILITGNIKHFPKKLRGASIVMTPREFIDQYASPPVGAE
jgi:putative PIN family toxin of toxin-antitoxin system